MECPAFQPFLELHDLGDCAFRPVIQRVRQGIISFYKTEVQYQLISTLDVHVPPNIDQVTILAVHSHRREMTGRSLHGLVAALMLPALLFAARADAERLDVELYNVLKQESSLQKEDLEVSGLCVEEIGDIYINIGPETLDKHVPRAFWVQMVVGKIQVTETIRDASQHVVHLHDVQEHVNVHHGIRVSRVLHWIWFCEEPGIQARRGRPHYKGHVAHVHCVIHRKRALGVDARLRQHHPGDAHRCPARRLHVSAGIQASRAWQRVGLHVCKKFGSGVIPSLGGAVGALRAAAQVVGQRTAAIDPRICETDVAVDPCEKVSHESQTVIYQKCALLVKYGKHVIQHIQNIQNLTAASPMRAASLTLSGSARAAHAPGHALPDAASSGAHQQTFHSVPRPVYTDCPAGARPVCKQHPGARPASLFRRQGSHPSAADCHAGARSVCRALPALRPAPARSVYSDTPGAHAGTAFPATCSALLRLVQRDAPRSAPPHASAHSQGAPDSPRVDSRQSPARGTHGSTDPCWFAPRRNVPAAPPCIARWLAGELQDPF